MPKSLKVMIKKLAHDGKITEEEYNDLIKKLDGHDEEVYDKAYDNGHEVGYELGYELGYASGHADGWIKCLEVNT